MHMEQRSVNGKMETVISVALMRESDAQTIAGGLPGRELMGRAAQGVYDALAWRAPVAILAGGGNNGGDGYALACLLEKGGFRPTVYSLSERLSEDGAYYRAQAKALGIRILPYEAGFSLASYALVVDAMLGTGFAGSLRSPYREAVEAVNQSGAYVVSVDISSGLNGDTGEAELAVQADLTVAIGYYKLGMFRAEGPRCSGKLTCVDIGIKLAEMAPKAE